MTSRSSLTASERTTTGNGGGSGEDVSSRSGWLKKKSTWSSWKDVFVIIRGGLLLEYKKEGAEKPSRVLSLQDCTVQLATLMCGAKHSFTIIRPNQKKKKDQSSSSAFWKCENDSELLAWLSVLRQFCAESELEWQSDEFLESIEDAAVLADTKMTILGANDAALRLLGYSRSTLFGKQAEILMPPEVARMHAGYVQRYLDTNVKRLIGKPRKLTVVRANGSTFVAFLCLGEIPPAANSNTGVQFLARIRPDIQQQVTSEALASSISTIIESTLRSAQEDILKQLQGELKQVDTAIQAQQTTSASSGSSSSSGSKSPSGSRSVVRSLSAGDGVHFNEVSEDELSEDREGSRIYYDTVEVHERIAEGGGSGAVVYSCSVDGWGCCMKEIPTEGVTGTSLQSILNEVSVLEQLPYHKNLVRYLFHHVTASSVQIFMRRYHSNLSQELRRRKLNGDAPYPAADIAKYAMDIITGLSVLHSRKLLHRDLKSDNIFVTLNSSGNISYLSLGDFDSAKTVRREAAAHSVVGTPGYMAPEILLGEKYSFPIDVFAFGMVLFELLTLHRPFEEEKNVFRVSQFIIEGKKPTMPVALAPEYADLIKLVGKCLRSKPERRPSLANCKSVLVKYLLGSSSTNLSITASSSSSSSTLGRK